MNLRARTATMAAVLLELAGGDPTTAADEPKPVLQRPQLNPIDPNRVWNAARRFAADSCHNSRGAGAVNRR
jgi:hypothetical protein